MFRLWVIHVDVLRPTTFDRRAGSGTVEWGHDGNFSRVLHSMHSMGIGVGNEIYPHYGMISFTIKLLSIFY